MSKVPLRVRDVVGGSVHPKDMDRFWRTPSESLGGLTPEQYYEQMSMDNLLIAIQNDLEPNDDKEKEKRE